MAVLGVDIGTSSVRASIYADNLRPARHGAQIRYRWRIGPDGSIDAPASLLERAVARAIDAALEGVHRPIDAVGVAAFWHSLVGLDESGRAITPVLPWSDMRSGAEAVSLRERIDERAVHARTGCRLHPTYWPSRLRWFAAHDSRTFRRVRRWASFPAYLERRWLGRSTESRSQASGTGMFRHESGTWDEELCEACDVDGRRLGTIVDLDYREADLSAGIARRWPALRDARWVPAAGDGAVNNLGAGCVHGDRAALMIGTSGALRLVWGTTAPPPVPFGLWRYWLDRRRVVVGGALSNGGNLLAWLRRTLGIDATARLDARLARLGPDGHQLTVLPFLAGERSPEYLPDARGAIAGLRLATTREEILRAGLESVAYRFAMVFDELTKIRPVKAIVATGTALTTSPVWMQILADTLGRSIALPRDPELTMRGAAILAVEQIGRADHAADPAIARVFRPDAGAHAIYRAAAERQRRLLSAIT